LTGLVYISAVVEKYIKDGYADSSHPELMKPMGVPAILFAGRRSNVIGAENIEAAVKALKVSVRWFENSGHFIYVEEPKEFADAAADFITGVASTAGGPSGSSNPTVP